ncbi:surface antigen BspA-like [Trichomonas vaginalis G3]|uniref:Surface antigen BspA-like n=1 Tax=Trichomonas vaginalis (strain ATCC PRA-98 / G3) TaxID=412133 RepID=A2DFG6_TRIV3|nr:regulation of response to stimulus [Trichomonas vaginalis G3]EAY20894.1 surface antigen BspA-like [Trichomonas vaginalis G3]KAI5521496.1 regulation of response to stimulus [Trichomonas vaginalis G3]|eukprot:XP_001581880.1 surface antigen BspA-like [Trichomonas vaginalis G3]
MTEIPQYCYSDGGKTLNSVCIQNNNLIISAECEVFGGVDEINYCFKSVKNILETFSFKQNPNLRRINDYAFFSCSKLRSVDLSACIYLEFIGQYAFSKCSLVSSFLLPEGLKTISKYALSYLSITSINIPSTVSTIDDFAISYCYSLSSVTFSEGSQLRMLGANAFSYAAIVSFTVPENLAEFHGLVFSNVLTMKTIRAHSKNRYLFDDTKAIYNAARTHIIYCASNIGETYEIDPNVYYINRGCFASSRLSSIIIPDSVNITGTYVFYGTTNLKQITLPKSLKKIENNCFEGSGLTSIVIPDGVEEIGNNAFSNCKYLTSITLPKTLKSLGGNALPSNPGIIISSISNEYIYFDNYYVIYIDHNQSISQYLGTSSEIVLLSSVKTIKSNAFQNKQNLVAVRFEGESNLETIEIRAFSGCSKLNTFTFGSKIKYIGELAFDNTQLTGDFKFQQNLETIEKKAFNENTKITSLSFSSTIPLTISESAFFNCNSITLITFKTTNQISLGVTCFSGLSSLTYISIPESVISVGSGCFMNSGIEQVSFIGDSINFGSISASMFKGCTHLSVFNVPSNCINIGPESLSYTTITSITIPDSVQILDDQCFKACRHLESIQISSNSNLSRIGFGVFDGCSQFSIVNQFQSKNFVSESSAIYSSDRRRMHVYPPASTRIYFSLLEGVQHIEDSAFIGCSHLESILLPENSLISIGISSFQGCTHLKHITIPSSIQSVGSNAFLDCPLLKCGVLVQNINNKTFIHLLKSSGLQMESLSFCSGFSCKNDFHNTGFISFSHIAVFILV